MAKLRGIGITGLAGASFPYGVGYSAGIYTLGAKLQKLGVAVTYHVHGFIAYENTSNLTAIAKQAYDRGQKLVLFGHSLGADEVTRIANNLGNISVEVAACFDPTSWTWPIGPVPVTPNVKQCFDFYQGYLPGGGVLKLAKGNTKTILQNTNHPQDSHISIDDDPRLHQIVVDAVKAAL